jgi:sugar phosphate isomerase/epimerase
MMDRRCFLGGIAATAVAKPFSHPIGLNLFTVRGPLATAPAATYQGLAKAGVSTLEVRPVHLAQHAAMMKDAGLKPVHMFMESAVVTGAWEAWREYSAGMAAKFKMPVPPPNAPRPRIEEMIELAVKHGVKRIGTSMLLPVEREKAIEQYGRAADACTKGGVELYYHNHAYEFGGAKGARYIDRLHKELDPRVRLELDVFWAAITGNAPEEILKQWKGRVKSLHLKDLAPGATAPAVETDVKPESFREIGAGRLDFKKILKEAERAGVEHYLIELDFSPGDPMDSVRKCVAALRGISV